MSIIDPTTLWKEKLRHLVSAIQNTVPSHREVQNASRLIQTDHYERFAIELVQNASDQAVRAATDPKDVPATTARVIWREARLAVLNQGRPFDEKGLRAITSLALSDKTEAELVGNKGVGFKAVYEVSDEPRIYSGELRFSVPTKLTTDHLTALENAAWEVVQEPEQARFAEDEEALETLVTELLASPPFYYPRLLDEEDLAGDLEALGLSDLEGFATLVVLPLKEGTNDKVERALERLLSPGTLLFLPGIDRLIVEADLGLVEVRRSELRRGALPPLAADIETIQIELDGEETKWWRLRGDVRSHALAAAARELESWKEIDHAPVAVALPCPDKEAGNPLGSAGRFCMGLPTELPTGLPLWVDGRFHGRLNREGLYLDTKYNDEVLAGARALFVKLLDHLRGSEDVSLRRAATLALKPSEGALAKHQDWGVETVLCADSEFRAPADIWLPRDRCFERWDGEWTTAPFELLRQFRLEENLLPEERLLDHCVDLLKNLGVEEDAPSDWLRRDGGHSPLEAAARKLRDEGGDWLPLLEWALDTFPQPHDELLDQVFLPVVGGLAARFPTWKS